jgi:hypothetical protein
VAPSNEAMILSIPASSSAVGTGLTSSNGTALEPTTGHPPASRVVSPAPPFHGTSQVAFRPACASWIPATAPCEWTNRAIRARGSTYSSLQMPRSPRVIRPSPVTAVASTITNATPPAARLPRWTRCQSSASPCLAMYWHMAAITTRLRSVTPRIVSGLTRSISGTSGSWSEPAGQPWTRSFCAWTAG